jgi:pyridoxamine 5'-phosphate oxidase
VRVEGNVARLSAEESETYFRTRPLGSRIAAWASPQSRLLSDRDELERLYEEASARFPDEEVPLPAHWGGFYLVPDAYEFWEHAENRLHDRIRYQRDGDGWGKVRLAP